jgi:ketosteroid isomerase-like protein
MVAERNSELIMLTEDKARSFAAEWFEAWNSHDLERIVSHYTENVVLISPVAAKLLNDLSGEVKGKQALRAYFKKGLEAFPQLRFEPIEVMWGLSSVVLHYANQKGTKSGEFMELDADGKIAKVVANYSG